MALEDSTPTGTGPLEGTLSQIKEDLARVRLVIDGPPGKIQEGMAYQVAHMNTRLENIETWGKRTWGVAAAAIVLALGSLGRVMKGGA